MNPKDQIRYWKKQFRILKSWRIYFDTKSEYKGQCAFNPKKKTCTIYDFPSFNGKEGMPEDYIFHEILHIAQIEIRRNNRSYKKRRQSEENFVQDICKIMKQRGVLKKVKKELEKQ